MKRFLHCKGGIFSNRQNGTLRSLQSLQSQQIRRKSTAAETRSPSSSSSLTTTTTSKIDEILLAQVEDMKQAGTFKGERIITGPQNRQVQVLGRKEKVLNFCANNYLGLCDDQELIQTSKDTLDSHGFGLASVQFIVGKQDIHKNLEQEIADFHGMDDAILFPSCFDANAGVFEAILTDQDAILSDSLNHASIIDGVRLCKANRFRYNHMDLVDLESKLIESKDHRIRLIATDSVFSMDGDIAPLKDICDLAEKHDAIVFIDDCHATGFVGETGRGAIERCDVHGRIAIINSTLGKALGGATGGYTAASNGIIQMMRQKARPLLFSNSISPVTAAAGLRVFQNLQKGVYIDRLQNLAQNTKLFRDTMTKAGFTLKGHYEHPIVPIMLGDASLAVKFAEEMLQENVYVIAFSYPVVPKNDARIRVQLSAAHTTQDVEYATQAFIKVAKKLNVL